MQQLGETLLNGLSMGAIYALIALGFSMVYGVLKLLNFAHSEIFTIGAFISYFTISFFTPTGGVAPFWVVPLAMLTAGSGAGLAAVVLQQVAYRPLRNQPKINVLLTGIGVSILLQNLGLKFFGARSRGVPPIDLPIPAKFVAVCILMASLTLLWALVEKTLFGVKMRAVAESSERAELCGIRPGSIHSMAFFIGGGFAGIGAVVWGMVYGNINPQMGFELGLKAFIISVVGGIGSLPGTCTAAIAMGIADKLLETYLPADISGYKQVFLLLILLAILIIKPRGLVRTPSTSEGK